MQEQSSVLATYEYKIRLLSIFGSQEKLMGESLFVVLHGIKDEDGSGKRERGRKYEQTGDGHRRFSHRS